MFIFLEPNSKSSEQMDVKKQQKIGEKDKRLN